MNVHSSRRHLHLDTPEEKRFAGLSVGFEFLETLIHVEQVARVSVFLSFESSGQKPICLVFRSVLEAIIVFELVVYEESAGQSVLVANELSFGVAPSSPLPRPTCEPHPKTSFSFDLVASRPASFHGRRILTVFARKRLMRE